MSAQIIQPTRPDWKFWLLWMLATIAGAAAGLVLSVPFQAILVALIGEDVQPPWTTTQTILILVFKGAEGAMMGLGAGFGQWLVMRQFLKHMPGWIFATGLAVFLQTVFRWSIPYDTPISQVGVMTALSFGILLGLCQWFVLRGRVANAWWWIVISFASWLPAAVSIYIPLDIFSVPGMVLFGVSNLLLPFGITGAGMVWLLRQTPSIQLSDAYSVQ